MTKARKTRPYLVTEVFEAVGLFEVQATSKADALRKVEDHLSTLGGLAEVTPLGGHAGHMVKRYATIDYSMRPTP